MARFPYRTVLWDYREGQLGGGGIDGTLSYYRLPKAEWFGSEEEALEGREHCERCYSESSRWIRRHTSESRRCWRLRAWRPAPYRRTRPRGRTRRMCCGETDAPESYNEFDVGSDTTDACGLCRLAR